MKDTVCSIDAVSNWIGRRAAMLGGVGVFLSSPLSAASADERSSLELDHAKFVLQMNLLLNRSDAPATGVVVSIQQHGQRIYQHCSGWANVLQGVVVTPETPFELASVSKPFTALAILQLMERGMLSLQDPVSRFMPELPSAWSAIDLHCLLSHQSGIPDILNEWPKRQLNRLTVAQLVQFFVKNPTVKFPPHQRGDYSNTNYVLLAEVISRVTGVDLDVYLRTYVFEPMGMQSSFSIGTATQQTVPSAQHYGVSEWIDGIHYKLSGAIGVKSSAVDVHRFIQGVVSHQLIERQTYELMTRVHTTFEDGRGYGYGWYITRPEVRSLLPGVTGGRALAHTGRLGAYRTAVYFDSQDHWDLVILGNGGQATEDLLVKVLALTRQHFEH